MKLIPHRKSNSKFLFYAVLLSAVLGLSGAFSHVAFAYYNLGTPTGFVNDYAGVLTSEQKQTLEQTLIEFEESSSNEIAVVVIQSLEEDYIENFAVELFEDWGIGKEKNDNGVLLLIAIDDRELRIEVGYGLEGALPDALAKRIIDDEIVPSFKSEDYYLGISSGVGAIMAATEGEYSPAVSSDDSGTSGSVGGAFIAWLIFGLIFLQWIIAILARTKSWWLGGVFGAVLGFISTLLFNLSFAGLPVTLVLIIIGLVLDYLVSREYKGKTGKKEKVPWWAGGGHSGGSSSSSSSSGGSFGGFGGGSSGGGGASGGW
jgi:uncharacterized protein